MSHPATIAGRLREAIRPYYLRHVYFPLRPSCRPPEFVRCWQAPHEFQGGDPVLDIPPPDPCLPDVLFLPMTDWHHRIQRTQRLAVALARLGRRCFLLNPHLGREYPAAPWRRRPPALAQLGGRVFEIHAPLRTEPVFHHRLLAPDESRAVADAVHWALQRAGTKSLDIISALPVWQESAMDLRQRWQALLVYDCHDWLAGFPNTAPAVHAAVPDSIRRSDLALFCGSGLRDYYGALLPEMASRFHFVGNGIPEWPEAPGPRPADPVVGYVGALEEWFWLEAVAEAARRLPQARFVLAGSPCRLVREVLGRMPNVSLKGEIPPSEVPEFLSGCRAGIIPRSGELARFMAPIKVLEYFHFGLPVVSGLMPELNRFGPLVLQASTPAEFAIAVKTALEENDTSREEARRAEARAATWRRRAEQLNQILLESRQSLGLPLS